MIRRTVAAGAATSVAAALLVPWAPAATAASDSTRDLKPATASPAKALKKGTVLDLGTAAGPETYIVQLESPAIPTRALEGAKGASTQRAEGEAAYGRELKAEQADLTSSIAKITGSTAKVLASFSHAINGITVRLTREQAQKVARIDGVSAVQVDFERQLTTDRGPRWIGAETIWDGSNAPGGVGTKGEGVLVGILDSGINPANPSFADTVSSAAGGDGYDHTNPFGAGNYKGMCNPTSPMYVVNWGCNDKLVGYYDFDVANNSDGNYDDDGHGSHTASTTAGNQVEAKVFAEGGSYSIASTIRGVAPHANIIAYDVCDGACQGSSIIAAINQSIIDGVDIINYSIGSASPSSPWTDADAVGFLNARAAGIHVATSAGNDGPGAATVGSPADVPWLTSVGASTHDRKYVSSVINLNADGGATLPNIAGAGLSGPTTPPGVTYPLVYAGSAPYNNAQCGQANDSTPAGTFPAGTDLTGLIVVCDRGGNGRVEKGENLAELGAEGMILANNQASGDSLSGDAHALPAAHISFDDGVALKAWMNSVTGEKAALSGSVADINDANGDIMASFSSRGPNRAISMISPSVSAPGVDILAAAGVDNDVEWHFISGTSMASPHTAGALTLLKALEPAWSPAEAQSALMTTSERDITDSDGTAADWFDMGSGRIELRRAAKAGLVLDENLAGYQGANPAGGGDVRELNTASMADDECLATCAWTRSFTGTATGVGTWTVSVENLSAGLALSTNVGSFAATDGGVDDVTVTATIASGTPTDKWLFGTLVLTPPAGSTAPVAHLPVGVLPSAGVLPESIDITTRRDAGSQLDTDLEAIAISDLQIQASGLVPEQRKSLSIVEDSTNANAFDGNGTHVEYLQVPAGATSLLASLDKPTAPDFDMYVGTGAVNAANVVCTSASGGSAESCSVAEPEAGTWWVLVQNWEASAPGGTDTTDLLTAVVAGDQGNLRAQGPEGPVPAATPFDIRTFWDEVDMDAGETWHGALTLGSAPGREGDIGVIPVVIHRITDDVTKTADKTTAAPGDVITYSIDVASNVTREDLEYLITDTLPEGTTYVAGSATNGAIYENGVMSWKGVLESTFGEEGNYTVRTSAQDPTCRPFTGPGYFDLAALGIAPEAGVTGDTVTFDAFNGGTFGFYGESYQGLTFSDDGFLLYGDANYADAGSEPWVAQQVPNPAKPNSVAALLWQDLQIRYDAATGAGVTLADTSGDGVFEDGDVAVVEYDNMRYFGNASGTRGQLDMQVFATAGSNDLVFAYDNITTGNGTLLGNAPGFEVTIGSENATASQAATLVNKGNANGVLTNGLNVCLDYAEPVAEGAGFTYQVLVGDVVGDRDLINKVVHTTDDPGAKPASATHTVKIKGSAQRTGTSLALNPDRISTGDTTVGTATVFTAGAAPATGQVQFLTGTRMVGTGTLDATGKATATLSGFTTAGTFPVTARYLGDGANAPSTSAPVNLVVEGPNAPIGKVTPRIGTKMVKPVEVGTRVKLRVTVRARDIVPSGTVKITLKGAGKSTTWTKTLNARGRTKVLLPKFRKTGKVRVRVAYSGDAATESLTKRIKFAVVDRRTIR